MITRWWAQTAKIQLWQRHTTNKYFRSRYTPSTDPHHRRTITTHSARESPLANQKVSTTQEENFAWESCYLENKNWNKAVKQCYRLSQTLDRKNWLSRTKLWRLILCVSLNCKIRRYTICHKFGLLEDLQKINQAVKIFQEIFTCRQER